MFSGGRLLSPNSVAIGSRLGECTVLLRTHAARGLFDSRCYLLELETEVPLDLKRALLPSTRNTLDQFPFQIYGNSDAGLLYNTCMVACGTMRSELLSVHRTHTGSNAIIRTQLFLKYLPSRFDEETNANRCFLPLWDRRCLAATRLADMGWKIVLLFSSDPTSNQDSESVANGLGNGRL